MLGSVPRPFLVADGHTRRRQAIKELLEATFIVDVIEFSRFRDLFDHVYKQPVRIPTMSIGRSDLMSITIPGDVDNALGAKRRR